MDLVYVVQNILVLFQINEPLDTMKRRKTNKISSKTAKYWKIAKRLRRQNTTRLIEPPTADKN